MHTHLHTLFFFAVLLILCQVCWVSCSQEICALLCGRLTCNPLLHTTLALIEMSNTVRCACVCVHPGIQCIAECVLSVHICACVCVRPIRPICMLFNEPWTAVPGQDEQLFPDWSVTWWWTWRYGVVVVGGGGVYRMFFHMKDQLPTFHLSHCNLPLSSPLSLSFPRTVLNLLSPSFWSRSNSADAGCNQRLPERMNHPLLLLLLSSCTFWSIRAGVGNSYTPDNYRKYIGSGRCPFALFGWGSLSNQN